MKIDIRIKSSGDMEKDLFSCNTRFRITGSILDLLSKLSSSKIIISFIQKQGRYAKENDREKTERRKEREEPVEGEI